MGISANRPCSGGNCGRGDDPGNVGGTGSHWGIPAGTPKSIADKVLPHLGDKPAASFSNTRIRHSRAGTEKLDPQSVPEDFFYVHAASAATRKSEGGDKGVVRYTSMPILPKGDKKQKVMETYRRHREAGVSPDDSRAWALKLGAGKRVIGKDGSSRTEDTDTFIATSLGRNIHRPD